MNIPLFIAGVISIAAGIWLINKARAREGVTQPKWMSNSMAQVVVFAVLLLIVLGLGLVVKAFTG